MYGCSWYWLPSNIGVAGWWRWDSCKFPLAPILPIGGKPLICYTFALLATLTLILKNDPPCACWDHCSMPSAIGCAGLDHVTRHQQTLTLCDLVRPSGSGSRWKPVKSCRACTFHGRLRAKMLMPRLMLLLESSFCIKPQRQLQTGPRMSPWLISALHVKFKDFTFFLSLRMILSSRCQTALCQTLVNLLSWPELLATSFLDHDDAWTNLPNESKSAI